MSGFNNVVVFFLFRFFFFFQFNSLFLSLSLLCCIHYHVILDLWWWDFTAYEFNIHISGITFVVACYISGLLSTSFDFCVINLAYTLYTMVKFYKTIYFPRVACKLFSLQLTGEIQYTPYNMHKFLGVLCFINLSSAPSYYCKQYSQPPTCQWVSARNT